MEVNSITRITPTNGAQGIDVYAEQRRRGEKVPEYAGDQLVQIRSYRATDEGFVGKEFAGADCTVSANNFFRQFANSGQSARAGLSCQIQHAVNQVHT